MSTTLLSPEQKLNVFGFTALFSLLSIGIFMQNIDAFSLSLTAIIAIYWVKHPPQLYPAYLNQKLTENQKFFSNLTIGALYLAPIINLKESIWLLTHFFNL